MCASRAHQGVCVCTFPLVMQLVEKFARRSFEKVFFDNSSRKTRGAALILGAGVASWQSLHYFFTVLFLFPLIFGS